MNSTLWWSNAGMLVAILAVVALGLTLDSQDQTERVRHSNFVTLAGSGTSDEVARVELTVPDRAAAITYVRDDLGWRIPAYRNAFARSDAVAGLLHAFIEARGTRVGRSPEHDARFGFHRKLLTLACYDAQGRQMVSGNAGGVVPGPRQDECYFKTSEGQDVLQLQANPWVYLEAGTDQGLPPLVDRMITPQALARRGLSRVEFSDPAAPRIRAVQRRDLPPVPGVPADRAPRFAWWLELADGAARQIPDQKAMAFLQGLSMASWMQLLDPKDVTGPLQPPLITVTLRYEDDVVDVLEIKAGTDQTHHLLHHGTTGQRFLIHDTTRRAYAPDPSFW